ncbi:FKBP-type peptidyl-prolyl cis-trans isomerase [Protaetiibacter intestinalis]|uniref:peptidylprolyl isomerase n=1 Tax=Protaetiibacter intestinalis TaxID=2419774 RepID=A0A387BAR7_9MICO|nr:hypothetical protein [Protaetiibacter intestinalis]AYF99011.1 hypothetical protein D7I47_12610 [Protaetiibacter intestinalis]
MRRIPALVSSVAVLTVLAASLAGCSPSTASCTPTIAAGETSALVEATGEVGSKPAISIPAPLTAKTPERSVIVEGEGGFATEGSTVDFEVSLVDAANGEFLDSTGYDENAFLGVAGRDGAMYQALVCARPGDRLAVTSTLGDSGLDVTSSATEDDLARSLVLVIDVRSIYLGKADGVNQLPQDGMPNVVTAPDGTPGVSVLTTEPPTETRISTIKAGSGVALADGDSAVLNLTAWVWPSDGSDLRQISTTWNKKPIVQLVANDPTAAQGVPPGVFDALVGARVGSQVLAVVAPDDSFADDSWPSGASAGDTLIYVIDVLGLRSTGK